MSYDERVLKPTTTNDAKSVISSRTGSARSLDNTLRRAYFAAGCFWGVQYYFDQVPGVIKSRVGYMGGTVPNPTDTEVYQNDTGHAEAVELEFDPDVVPYDTLLKHFFRLHDPTQLNRQGPDVGEQYRSAIFYVDDEQKQQAEAMIQQLQKDEKFKDDIVTQVVPAGEFFPAEDYHQKYAETTGRGMCHVAFKPI